MTYMSPGIPVEYYELLTQYLGEKLGCRTYLMYESRWSGPPADKPDPFTLGDADIGIVLSLLGQEKTNVVLPSATDSSQKLQ